MGSTRWAIRIPCTYIYVSYTYINIHIYTFDMRIPFAHHTHTPWHTHISFRDQSLLFRAVLPTIGRTSWWWSADLSIDSIYTNIYIYMHIYVHIHVYIHTWAKQILLHTLAYTHILSGPVTTTSYKIVQKEFYLVHIDCKATTGCKEEKSIVYWRANCLFCLIFSSLDSLRLFPHKHKISPCQQILFTPMCALFPVCLRLYSFSNILSSFLPLPPIFPSFANSVEYLDLDFNGIRILVPDLFYFSA